ncbi:Transposable element tcb1 transposase [Caligus rogercresseyi]|uniref:Transposable element tcb1 transposase n=1 Tax=Caligus rogercresseyi TaxID=217165 RepID=A0A7T8QVQ2_CALRO|nr:Transposable element tcb1 transposase [Caligus rogercresseyi]
MSLGFVASNGKAMPLIWFPTGYRLNAVDYVKILQEKFLPWVQENFPDNNVVLQQDGAPAHTAKVTQEFLGQHMQFWSKEMCPPPEPGRQSLRLLFLGASREQGLYCPPPECGSSEDRGGRGVEQDDDGLHQEDVLHLQEEDRGHHCC